MWGERADGRLVVTYTADRGLAEAARAEGRDVGQWDDDPYSIEERGAGEGYFLNHSCDSNLWFEGAFTLVARRGAEPGEELTIDYALFEADEAFRAPWPCRCGTEGCRGTVTGRDRRIPTYVSRPRTLLVQWETTERRLSGTSGHAKLVWTTTHNGYPYYSRGFTSVL